MNVDVKKKKIEKKKLNLERFYGYKHWTIENLSRCFYIGKGRKSRPNAKTQRNHKWHAIVKRYGYQWPEERRIRQSLLTKGRKGHLQTAETRYKIGLASRGRIVLEETRERNRQVAKRENLSIETLLRRSKSLSKRTQKFNHEGNLIETFDSLKQAAKSMHSSNAKLSVAIKLQKSFKGFIWKYVKEESGSQSVTTTTTI